MRVISVSLSFIVFSILRISIGVALAATSPARPGVLSRLIPAPAVVVVILLNPGAASVPAPVAPMVERVFELPLIAEPALLFERLSPGTAVEVVDIAGLLDAAVASFFASSSSFFLRAAAAVRYAKVILVAGTAVPGAPGLADTLPVVPLADVAPDAAVPVAPAPATELLNPVVLAAVPVCLNLR